MSTHLIDGEFQSDKYPTCPRGKVPLSVKDKSAQDLLWIYAQRRRLVDDEFSSDLEKALRLAGYDPAPERGTLLSEERLREIRERAPNGLHAGFVRELLSHIDALTAREAELRDAIAKTADELGLSAPFKHPLAMADVAAHVQHLRQAAEERAAKAEAERDEGQEALRALAENDAKIVASLVAERDAALRELAELRSRHSSG